ncbi:MAG: threonine-phosphate decarboxylase CobD [Pseudomonadota bacterium]
MAKSASLSDIFRRAADLEPAEHGGDLAAARRLFPGAPEPFIDLSTGINPNPYPVSRFSAAAFGHLPDSTAARTLTEIVARAYGAPSAAHVVLAPGTQLLLPLIAGLMRPGRAAILPPTYGEFGRAAALAGHSVAQARELAAIGGARLVFVANPNNPDGRLFDKNDLIALGRNLNARGGTLVVDEAFMDVGPAGASLAPEVSRSGIIVLRSFGKFFGLAGLRLGFAMAPPPTAARLSALLGPWAVSGPALAVATKALADWEWIEAARARLAKKARRLEAILAGAGLQIVGATILFRLARTSSAGELFHQLGRAGILARRFSDKPDWLRFGLPANEPAWQRLQIAMADFRRRG